MFGDNLFTLSWADIVPCSRSEDDVSDSVSDSLSSVLSSSDSSSSSSVLLLLLSIVSSCVLTGELFCANGEDRHDSLPVRKSWIVYCRASSRGGMRESMSQLNKHSHRVAMHE